MHKPVLANKVVECLSIKKGGTYVDGTLGSAGHAELILQQLGTEGRLLGIDRDEEAIARSRRRLAVWGKQCIFTHGNFADMVEIGTKWGIEKVDGILLDLGVSSEQLESSERGFSFMTGGPLDMRMDRSCGMTAADLVNGLPEDKLEAIIRTLGEERAARRIGRALVKERAKRSIESTVHLAEVVEKAKGGRRGRIHPATKTFQAIRIAVNREIEALEQGLEAGLCFLRDGGRMAVISFHSLEDRVVKKFFKEHAGFPVSLEGGGSSWRGKKPAVSLVTRKPLTASGEEVEANPRSRSAKLRAAERLKESE